MTAKKWKATITRDLTQRVTMGPLVVAPLGMKQFGTEEIAPARTIEFPYKAGETREFKTKRGRDAFIKAINLQHHCGARPSP